MRACVCNLEMKERFYEVLGDIIAPLYFCLIQDYVTQLELSEAHSTAWHRHRGQSARVVSRKRN